MLGPGFCRPFHGLNCFCNDVPSAEAGVSVLGAVATGSLMRWTPLDPPRLSLGLLTQFA
jgi:hypothetical protein